MAALFRALIFTLAAVVLLLATVLRLLYGGGSYYPDLSTAPLLSDDKLEVALQSTNPSGTSAVSRMAGSFSRSTPNPGADQNKLMEWNGNAAVPYPERGDAEKPLSGASWVLSSINRTACGQSTMHSRAGDRPSVGFRPGNQQAGHGLQSFLPRVAQPARFCSPAGWTQRGRPSTSPDVSFFRRTRPSLCTTLEEENPPAACSNRIPPSIPEWIIRNPDQGDGLLQGG